MGIAESRGQPRDAFDALIARLKFLCDDAVRIADSHAERIDRLPEARRASARNLLHYLALRRHDLRSEQEQLARLGLSSLGRAESNVLATLEAVLHNLYLLSGQVSPDTRRAASLGGPGDLSARLEHNTAALLGDPPSQRRARIMVTMPENAADDYMMLHRLVEGGMDCLRINCAHGDPDSWARMIKQKAHAERVMKRSCRVLMDLRGPKMRSGPMEPAAPVMKIRPRRNEYGEIVRPARIWLTAEPGQGKECDSADACLSVPRAWLSQCEAGDTVRLKDARGSKRRWRIVEVGDSGCWAAARKTTYVTANTRLVLKGKAVECITDNLPERESIIHLRHSDYLQLVNTEKPGRAALIGDDGAQLRPGRVSLPIPEVYRDARPGDRIGFDDGRISGIIDKRQTDRLRVRIDHTRKPLEKLGSDKGVNLPDTPLDLPALSAEDVAELPFVAAHADMIGLSFTNTPDDVAELRQRLVDMGHEEVGVVIKIETRRGFHNLPDIILQALEFPACGVMIARGDLAAECGFERMAELQEEILWICEAAHVPVIWATQVLEGLTKRGHASRAEITDAAIGQSAECVMLNKGPYVQDAVRTLNDILHRMQDHQSKKRSMMRKLGLAADYAAASGDS
ncbi:MAG: pyruvate kinase [Xanthomonadales bacterium]|nr:pyruvate kinase [Gammaproteobacteria bacterium]MBT8049849.1 pyruvate kinase [Gammaproteobacteria bacterium]MBT8056206.1 pyruvate kinase [Gammaproteobacteria bacterium]NNJ78586.1 pyruvate kinase [Xanthomonadales bacterium]NNL04276.1 pyruvate kinase [Xanthomonadales bacterium]